MKRIPRELHIFITQASISQMQSLFVIKLSDSDSDESFLDDKLEMRKFHGTLDSFLTKKMPNHRNFQDENQSDQNLRQAASLNITSRHSSNTHIKYGIQSRSGSFRNAVNDTQEYDVYTKQLIGALNSGKPVWL